MVGLAFWRDVSLTVLVLEAFLVCLPIAVIGVFIVRGLQALRRWLGCQFPVWQAYTLVGQNAVARYARVAITPVLAAAAAYSMIAAALRTASRMARARRRTYYR